MNALKTGIDDAQSQIITGEDPEDLERLTARLLRRLRKTESQLWDRSTTKTAADNRKWGRKAEAYPLAAAFRDQQRSSNGCSAASPLQSARSAPRSKPSPASAS